MSFKIGRLAPSLLIAACSVAALGAADDTVAIKDFRLKPMGNIGAEDDTFSLHLKALLGVGYDSNVYAREEDVVGDAYGRAAAGLELRHELREGLRLSLNLLADSATYVDESDRDLFGGKAVGKLEYEGDSSKAGLSGDYERYDDPLVQTGERIQRETWGGAASWSSEGADARVSATADVHRTDYLEDAGGFVAEDRNVLTSRVGLRYTSIGGENREMWIRGIAGTDTYDTNRRLQDDTVLGAALGAQMPVGERSKILVEAGAEHRAYSDEYGAGYDDETRITPLASVVLVWPWDEAGGELRVRGYTEARNSFSANTMQVSGLAASARYATTDQVFLVGGLEGLNVRDYAAAPGDEVEARTTGIVNLGVEYRAMDGIALRLIGKQTVSDAYSGDGADYTRSEVAFETAFIY